MYNHVEWYAREPHLQSPQKTQGKLNSGDTCAASGGAQGHNAGLQNYHQLNNTAIKPNSGRNIKKVHVWFSLPWLYQAQAVKMRHLCPSPRPSLFLSTAVTKRATNLWHNNAQKDSIQKRQSVIPSKRVRCSEAIKILKSKDNILP